MANYTSNADKVIQGLKDLPSQIDLRNNGLEGEGAAGDDIRELIVLGIEANFNAQKDPTGGTWPDNAPLYKKAKGNRAIGYGPDRKASGPKAKHPRPAHRGGLMRSQVEMMGKSEITTNSVTCIYGATDEGRKEAQWFSNGSEGFPEADGGGGEKSGAKNQPARPFFSLTPEIGAQCDAYVQEWVETHLVSM